MTCPLSLATRASEQGGGKAGRAPYSCMPCQGRHWRVLVRRFEKRFSASRDEAQVSGGCCHGRRGGMAWMLCTHCSRVSTACQTC
jgi:hypothetical protein